MTNSLCAVNKFLKRLLFSPADDERAFKGRHVDYLCPTGKASRGSDASTRHDDRERNGEASLLLVSEPPRPYRLALAQRCTRRIVLPLAGLSPVFTSGAHSFFPLSRAPTSGGRRTMRTSSQRKRPRRTRRRSTTPETRRVNAWERARAARVPRSCEVCSFATDEDGNMHPGSAAMGADIGGACAACVASRRWGRAPRCFGRR